MKDIKVGEAPDMGYWDKTNAVWCFLAGEIKGTFTPGQRDTFFKKVKECGPQLSKQHKHWTIKLKSLQNPKDQERMLTRWSCLVSVQGANTGQVMDSPHARQKNILTSAPIPGMQAFLDHPRFQDAILALGTFLTLRINYEPATSSMELVLDKQGVINNLTELKAGIRFMQASADLLLDLGIALPKGALEWHPKIARNWTFTNVGSDLPSLKPILQEAEELLYAERPSLLRLIPGDIMRSAVGMAAILMVLQIVSAGTAISPDAAPYILVAVSLFALILGLGVAFATASNHIYIITNQRIIIIGQFQFKPTLQTLNISTLAVIRRRGSAATYVPKAGPIMVMNGVANIAALDTAIAQVWKPSRDDLAQIKSKD